MGVLMTIQNEQNTQKINMKNIESKVLEMYNDCDDAEYDEQDAFFYQDAKLFLTSPGISHLIYLL
jgi:hypothetical protein